MNVVLGIDGGGTRTRASIVAGEKTLAHAENGSIKRLRVGAEAAEANLRALLNTLIEANVKPEEQGRVAGDAERFRADLSAWLVQRHQTETRPRIAQALKRQIRILNVDLQEKGIPAMPKLHDLGAKMPFEHPRELFKDAEPTLGAQLGKGSAQLHMPAAEPAEPGDGYRAERGEQNG